MKINFNCKSLDALRLHQLLCWTRVTGDDKLRVEVTPIWGIKWSTVDEPNINY